MTSDIYFERQYKAIIGLGSTKGAIAILNRMRGLLDDYCTLADGIDYVILRPYLALASSMVSNLLIVRYRKNVCDKILDTLEESNVFKTALEREILSLEDINRITVNGGGTINKEKCIQEITILNELTNTQQVTVIDALRTAYDTLLFAELPQLIEKYLGDKMISAIANNDIDSAKLAIIEFIDYLGVQIRNDLGWQECNNV